MLRPTCRPPALPVIPATHPHESAARARGRVVLLRKYILLPALKLAVLEEDPVPLMKKRPDSGGVATARRGQRL